MLTKIKRLVQLNVWNTELCGYNWRRMCGLFNTVISYTIALVVFVLH